MCSNDTSHAFKALKSYTEELSNQFVLPVSPDNITSDFFLKQSTFVANHFFEARNEFFSIVKNTSFAYENKYYNESTSDSDCSDLRDHENCKSSVSYINNAKTIKSCVTPQKSKVRKKSKHIKKIYFLTKEIAFTYNNFIPSSFIRNMCLNVRKMKFTNANFKSCIKYIKRKNCQNDSRLTEKNHKVVVEKASTSSICFGSISALSNFVNEDELNVAIDNYCYEESISSFEIDDIEFDLKHNDVCNEIESNHKHSILDKNLNVLSLEKENPFLNCARNNESRSLKKLKFRRNGYMPVYSKIKSQENNSSILARSRPLRIKKKQFPGFIQNFGYKRKHQKAVIDFELLKKNMLDGKSPVATVVLKRLSDEFIQKSISKMCHKRIYRKKSPISSTSIKSYQKPAYILSGAGTKLKDIPGVEDNIRNASKRTIHLIHHVLFGTIEMDHACRKNILEFNGYSALQKNFISHSNIVLNNIPHADIKAICKTFLVNVKGFSEEDTIERLFQFLLAPSSAISKSPSLKESKVQLSPVKLKNASHRHHNPSVQSSTIETTPPILNHTNNSEISNQSFEIKPSLKLQNLEKVCFNIECAAPEDLIELNDLLFIKPCDSTEIHSKILDFTYFPFIESSIEYHYRKTLLNYMNFNILKKIAVLLDIPHSENSNHSELSSDIFNFLMEPKQKNTNKSRNKPNGTENKSCVNESKSCIMESKSSNIMEKMEKKSSSLTRNQALTGVDSKVTNGLVNNKPNHVMSKVRNIKFQLNKVTEVGSDIPSSQCPDHDYFMSCDDEAIQETENCVIKKFLNGEELNLDGNIPFFVHTRNYVKNKKRSNISSNSHVDSKKNISDRFHPYYVATEESKTVSSPIINKKPAIKLTRSPLITRVQAL